MSDIHSSFSDEMPPNVVLKLQGMMFAAPLSTAAFIAGLSAMTAVFALKLGDHTMASIAATLLSLNLIRVALVAWMVSSDARASIYLSSLLAIGCVFSIPMSALVIRAFESTDVEAIAMTVIVAAGYLSGVLIRASVVPRLAIPHILTLFLPLIVASAVASDGRYWPTTFLLSCFCIGCIDLSRIIHSHIAAQFMAEHVLSLAAKTDDLTGLANRIALDAALSGRFESTASAIFAMIDLDGFKTINDSHGHAVGDCLLKTVAQRMITLLAEEHLAARVGGDEFAVLFAARVSVTDATRICEDIVRVLSAIFRIDGIDCRIGASVGLASSSCPATMETIKLRADKALYVAKRHGRGQVVWSTASPSIVPAFGLADNANDNAPDKLSSGDSVVGK